MDYIKALLASGIVKGALTGALGAAAADIHSFKTWTDYQDAINYKWGVAAFRWFQGAVLGALTAAGIGAL